jgi:hypothetical protein
MAAWLSSSCSYRAADRQLLLMVLLLLLYPLMLLCVCTSGVPVYWAAASW